MILHNIAHKTVVAQFVSRFVQGIDDAGSEAEHEEEKDEESRGAEGQGSKGGFFLFGSDALPFPC
jgi:hypothetical protein